MPSSDLELTKRPGGGAVDIETLKRRSWPGITAHYVRFAGPLEFDFRIDQPTSYIALHGFRRVDGETSTAGLPRSYTKDLRNKLTFAPAGCLVEGWSQIAKPGSLVTLHLTQTELAQAASTRQPIDLANLSPQVAFDDHALRMALLRFQEILHDPSLDIPGYAETLGELVAFELGRIASHQPRQLTHQGGLTARQVRIVTEYMDAHLTDKITISELAALLDLTRFHFIRTFKQATGTPPHQFMIRRRVDRAKELLADSRSSVAEVAERTGFGSPIQLTRAFRRVLGTTPSAVRRSN
jgi:AraC family transcriptional regulator